MQLLADDDRPLVESYAPVTLTFYVDGEKQAVEIAKASYSGASAGGEEFSFGNACACGMTLELAQTVHGLKGKGIQVNWSVSEREYALFTGKIDSAVVTAGRTTIQAWDELYFSGSDVFTAPANLLSDCSAYDALNAVATAMGLTIEVVPTMSLLVGVTISGGLADLPSDATNAAVAGYIAALVGGNALIGRAGNLIIRQVTFRYFKTETYSGGANAESEDYTISGITLQREVASSKINENGTTSETTETQEFSAGDGSLMLTNPLADQAAADRAYEVMGGLTIRPGQFSFPGGIQLEPSDVIEIVTMDGTYSVAAGTVNMEIDGGVKTTITCGGAAHSGGSGGSINQALKRLQADYAQLKKLVADNATINSAYIKTLLSEYIDTGLLSADVIKLQDAYVDSWEALDAFILEHGADMAEDTQRIFSAGFDFAGIMGQGIITISVGRDGNAEPCMLGTMMSKAHHYAKAWSCEGDFGGSPEDWYSSQDWEPVGARNFIGFKRVLTEEDDLDQLTEPGVYRYSTASVPKNCPFPNAGMVEVIPSDGTSGVMQRVTRYGVAGYKKERIQYSGSWLDWMVIPLVFTKTYTSTTNTNGNATTGIPAGYRILDITATDADGGTTYLCHKYWSASQNRWYVNVTTVTSKENVANTSFTFTIYYIAE